MADYDAGEVTDRERLAAEHQTATSRQNVRDVRNQLDRQLGNYDLADIQNRNLAEVQRQQNSRKTSADRFEAQRDLQNAAIGLLGSMGGAMNGSSLGNLMTMLRDRNDKENSTYWAQHQVNQDQVDNALQDSLNQNEIARRDAMQSAEKAVRDIEGDWRANMNNINPNLFPGESGRVEGLPEEYGSEYAWQTSRMRDTYPDISGYVMPDTRTSRVRNNLRATSATLPMQYGSDVSPQRNRMQGNDYFSQMMNRFNGR